MAAGLLLVPPLGRDLHSNGLPVRHARLHQCCLHTEFALQPGHRHIQVLLAQAAENLLMGLVVDAKVQGRILLAQSAETGSHFLLLAFLGHFHSHGIGGARNMHTVQGHHLRGTAKGIAGGKAAQLGHCTNIPGGQFADVRLLGAEYAYQLAHTLLFAGAGVVSRGSGSDFAADHLEVRQLADKRIRHRLKADRSQGSVGVRGQLDRLTVSVCRILALRRRTNLCQEIQQQIAGRLCQTAQGKHRDNGAVRHTGFQPADFLLRGQLLALKIFFHQLFISRGHSFRKHGLYRLKAGSVVRLGIALGALAVCIRIGLAVNHIVIGSHLAAGDDGHDHRAGRRAELGHNAVKALVEIRTIVVHFGRHQHPRHTAGAGVLKCLFRTHSQTAAGRHHDHRRLCGAQALKGPLLKVKQTGGVNKVQLFALIFYGSHGAGHADVALFLLGVKVSHRVAVSHFAGALRRPCQMQHSLQQGGFALGSVTCKRNVPNLIRCISFHKSIPL